MEVRTLKTTKSTMFTCMYKLNFQVIVLYNLLYASLGFQLCSSLKWGWKTEPTSGFCSITVCFSEKKNSGFVSHRQSLLRKGSINGGTDILKQQSQILNVIAKAKVLKKTEYILARKGNILNTYL